MRIKVKESKITRRSQRPAETVPPLPNDSLDKAFARIDRIRRRTKPLPKGMTIKDLIEEGRR